MEFFVVNELPNNQNLEIVLKSTHKKGTARETKMRLERDTFKTTVSITLDLALR